MTSRIFQIITNQTRGTSLLYSQGYLESVASIRARCTLALVTWERERAGRLRWKGKFSEKYIFHFQPHKYGTYLILLWNIGSVQFFVFQVGGFHEVRICLLQIDVGYFLLLVGRFRPFLACFGSFRWVRFVLRPWTWIFETGSTFCGK